MVSDGVGRRFRVRDEKILFIIEEVVFCFEDNGELLRVWGRGVF